MSNRYVRYTNIFFLVMLRYIDLYFPGSSSGRTPRSGRGNWGPNPYPGALCTNASVAFFCSEVMIM